MKQKTQIIDCEHIIIKGTESREEIVRKVINTFINNEADKRGHSVKFRYPVEQLSSGEFIYIFRPAGLNKYNFDFKVEVKEEFGLNKGKHEDIKNDILKKKIENPNYINELKEAIKLIFECKENNVDNILKRYPNLLKAFNVGANVEVLLKILKWLFVMEDIVYWNYLGRKKLYDFISEVFDE
ncbi:MAG: hypothetical protein N2560_04000 [Ignavibacteria bacterium]|nr:hypothetical protein [Ignavibacteria bacterium]